MKWIMLGILTVIFNAPAQAAYQNPTIVSNDKMENGTYRLVFEFVGNAGEPTVRRDFLVDQNTTAPALRNWVDDVLRALDGTRNAGTLPALQVGQIVPRSARSSTPPTAKQIWQAKLERYMQFKDIGIAAAASDLAALKADLESTYQSGYLDQ